MVSRTSVSSPQTNVNRSDPLLRILVAAKIFMGGIYELNIKTIAVAGQVRFNALLRAFLSQPATGNDK